MNEEEDTNDRGPGQPARHSARFTDLTAAGESLHALVRVGWKMLGLERSLGSRIVTYADDLVILCRKGKAEEALQRLREIMGKLKLTVNEEKTRICKVPEGEFDFLGYSFGRILSENRQAYWGTGLEEEHQAHGRERPRADHPIVDLARDHRAGEPV